jgi:hypothetical protein
MLHARFNLEVFMALDFDLTEEQQMLRKMVRNFAEKEIAPLPRSWMTRKSFPIP